MSKNPLKANWDLLAGFVSDQNRGIEHPPLQRSLPEGAEVVRLPLADPDAHSEMSPGGVIDARKSVRKFTGEPITMEELSWLLWATQGVKKVLKDGVASLRTVPSGGARHPMDTYLIVNGVTDLEPGLYRYLPVDHSLVRLGGRIAPETAAEGCLGQPFAGDCAVCFVWSAIPYRTSWRYGPVSDKIIALDAGHICQNLYIACTALGLGTCAIGAYDQEKMDGLLGLDGEDEFVIYVSPVGRLP